MQLARIYHLLWIPTQPLNLQPINTLFTGNHHGYLYTNYRRYYLLLPLKLHAQLLLNPLLLEPVVELPIPWHALPIAASTS